MSRPTESDYRPAALVHALVDGRVDVMEIAGRRVHVASIEDMLAMKRAAGRPQDLMDIESLEIARERTIR